MITKIIKFGAEWCGPCKALKKTLTKVTVPVQEVDVDEEEEMTALYNIRNIPVLVFLNEDKEVDRLVGAVGLDKINAIIDKWDN